MTQEESCQWLVSTAVNAVVEHYRQSIHLEQPPSSSSACPPVVQHWVERLVDKASNHDDSPQEILCLLLESYETCIRPSLFENETDRSGMSFVVMHYELLVRQVWNQIQHTVVLDDCTLLSQTLQTLACDITLATAGSSFPEADPSNPNNIRSNVLSSLLGLMYTCILCVHQTYGNSNRIDAGVRVRCAVSLLAFDDCMPRRNLDPRQVSETLADRLCHVSQYCVHPDLRQRNFIVHEMDWDAATLEDASAWDDQLTTKITRDIWFLFAGSDIQETAAISLDSFQQTVIQQLGTKTMAKAVRAHFFGRDQQPSTTTMTRPLQKRLHLGHTVSVPQDDTATTVLDQPPYLSIPSRVHVALRFISLLQSGQQANVDTTVVLGELLPVCFTLLDAANDVHRALGAAALHSLLTQYKPAATNTTWPAYAANIQTVLDGASKTTRLGPVVALIGLAQHELFLKTTTSLRGGQHKQRRVATQQWLVVLQKNNFNDALVWGLLTGAILPSLYQHAMDDTACEAMELGRLGLCALLPLLRHDEDDALIAESIQEATTSRQKMEIQLLSLLALSNLLLITHPIMPHHGGKILSTLLSFSGHSCNNELTKIAVSVAAQAVVVCGPRAVNVLDRVRDGEYEDRLVQLANDVAHETANLQNSTHSGCE